MKIGLSVPNLGTSGSAPKLVELAKAAEAAGWDGFFVWDHILFRTEEIVPMVEPWTALAAIGQSTSSITIGVMVTPLSRRRPHVLARQIATVDELAPGRVVLGVGLGTAASADFGALGEIEDESTRAERLDEALTVVRGLLTEDHFSYGGEHFEVKDASFLPRPANVPIWVGGRWPNHRPFRRAAKQDGVFIERAGGQVSADDTREAVDYCRAHGAAEESFDVVVGGRAGQARDSLEDFQRAGATWYLEYLPWRGDATRSAIDLINDGPPSS